MASGTFYDAVIVGAGISGALIAGELSRAGKRVLILEAGPAGDMDTETYDSYLTRFYATAAKDNQSPFPPSDNAPMPRSKDVHPIGGAHPDASAYIVQNGPFATDSTYTRVLGGTTLHWEGKTLRMLPEDFETHTRYGQGRDWPIGYADLEPFYREAEREIGVSADVEDQAYLGISFPPGYVYPMRGLPLSYLDKVVASDVDGMPVELGGERYDLRVRPFPQGRNGIPNPKYDGGKGYRPVGAVSTSQVEEGGRCQGNNNCVPLCPVQAKYNALKTLTRALQTGLVDILPQTVASKVHVDHGGRVSHIEYKTYHAPDSKDHTTGTVRGQLYVLSANAIENARLLLASGLTGTSGLVGRNLMDHAYLLAWGLLPEIAGTFRGTICTGGITDLRGGAFRRDQAGFAVDIHNDGWGWATGSPWSDVLSIVDDHNKFGAELFREALAASQSRIGSSIRRSSRGSRTSCSWHSWWRCRPASATGSRCPPTIGTSWATCARSSRTASRTTRCAASSTPASCRAASSSAPGPRTTPGTTPRTTATSRTRARASRSAAATTWAAPM